MADEGGFDPGHGFPQLWDFVKGAFRADKGNQAEEEVRELFAGKPEIRLAGKPKSIPIINPQQQAPEFIPSLPVRITPRSPAY